ncbi:adhesion G protein-coupled receptor F4-like [Hippocampus zosterae]|uniref:adhesion G protein-coupled receptor F4-like n=1 Tax=Hippocampus zosterae TaxID=109293 RepID=UPI00223DC7F4|nr:adhesion G protein-coupled receptor F4-like [Hippocampus zosterae]
MSSTVLVYLLGFLATCYQFSTVCQKTTRVPVPECVAVEGEHTCNCANGYIWSSEVCDKLNCCSDAPCKRNVLAIASVCIAKVQGFLSISPSSRLSNCSVDFEVDLSVKCDLAKLRGVVSTLEGNLGAVFRIKSVGKSKFFWGAGALLRGDARQLHFRDFPSLVGLVTIEPKEAFLPHRSESTLKCTFEEASNSSGWRIKRNEPFELHNGSVVKLHSNCATEEHKSCTAVTLRSVTSLWAGVYECEFTSGTFSHTATTVLRVAPLPEEIYMTAKPVTVDCSKRPSSENVTVDLTATVRDDNETYQVSWSYRGGDEMQSTADSLGYHFKVAISCQEERDAHSVNVTFKNVMDQPKSARLEIPVIYGGDTFCEEEGDLWPKTPDGETVIKRTCPEGRVGYESRTCQGKDWQPVFSNCVSHHLVNLTKAAEVTHASHFDKKYLHPDDPIRRRNRGILHRFVEGQGATAEASIAIFAGLLNSSESNSNGNSADLTASVRILELMAEASERVPLKNAVLHDFTHAASNLLAPTWEGVNDSVVHKLSSSYLGAVERLVKNIQIDRDENNLTTCNLVLNFCPARNCSVTLFGSAVVVTRNGSSGLVKLLGVRNLTDKLQNHFGHTEPSPLLVAATLEDEDEPSLTITLDFFGERAQPRNTFCVYWEPAGRWSEEGCAVANGAGNRTRCVCNHLSAFSALWGFGERAPRNLVVLTTVGLMVSIFSLVLFLLSQFLVWSAVVKTDLSHFYHTVMVNVALFLLLAHCAFLVSSFTDLSQRPAWCRFAAVCKHFFFLAAFCWMLCMSVTLVHHLVFVFKPLSKRVFMFLSGTLGYVCPMLMVGSTYIYCQNSDTPYHDESCWLVPGKAFQSSLSSFLFPVGSIIVTNLGCVAVVIARLTKTPPLDGVETDRRETAKRIVKAVVFLTPVLGLTWIVGYFLYITDRKDPFYTVVNYSFCILNSFQGLSILLSGCLAEQKVRDELLKLIKGDSTKQNEEQKTSTICMKGK